MFAGVSVLSMGIFLVVFCGIMTAAYFVFWRPYGDDARAISRLRGLSSDAEPPTEPATTWREWLHAVLPRLGATVMPNHDHQLQRLKVQLGQAGVYQPGAVRVFWGVKLVLLVALSVLCGAIPYLGGFLSLPWAMLTSVAASAVGLAAPNLWLHLRIKSRQRELRKALPDFLDMLVLCLEGGLSMSAALPRIVGEMIQVHPTLGEEMTITQQTANLGLSVGDAFKQLGDRCDLADVRDLASVILQSERFGASLVKTLRTHADAYRVERQQRAEEAAQKAAVKILFPMLFFIFPAVFIVLLGPAAFQMANLFSR
jgi:tight adherence protein C